MRERAKPPAVDCYDYVRRTYGVPAYVGVRVRVVPTREGVIVAARSDLHYVHVRMDDSRGPVPYHPRDLSYLVVGSLERERMARSLDRLIKKAVYNDNGHCSICGGYWPNEHNADCVGREALAAIGRTT